MDETLGILLIVLILIVPFVLYFVCEYMKYKNSSYYKLTQNSYFEVNNNAGAYGEFSVYKNLQYFENLGAKFLFNLYIPAENGKTTEIDVLMICSHGIFVFESKNFSGWIFGNERQRKWTQSLPVGYGECHKEYFYNPIMQNAYHIKHLRNIIEQDIRMLSVIVFSDNCTLKNIQVSSENVFVVYLSNLKSLISNLLKKYDTKLLSKYQQDEIYNRLYSFSQVSDFTKMNHILNLKPKK